MRAHQSTIVTLAIAVPIAAVVLGAALLAEPEAESQGSLTLPSATASVTPTPTADPATTAVATNSGNDEHPPPEDVQLGECTTEQFVGPTARGTLTNNTAKLSDYMISVNFADEAGVIVAQGLGFANNIPAGASATWEASAFDDVPYANCTIVKVERISAVG
jgi:hypothetical protein